LRANTTEAERKLWRALKDVPVEGTHFRKQVPIGPYVADFACLAAKLIIELDGGQHNRDDVSAKDRARQQWLQAEGYRVLRFWNGEVSANLDGTIYPALHGSLAGEAEPFRHPRRPRPKGVTPPRPLRGRPSSSRGG
jgi:very-short-patch-repair endonuclease